MNLIAPLRIWRIRRDLKRIEGAYNGYRVKLERRAPVRFGDRQTREYWQYVNHIRTPTKTVKLVLGCVETMIDNNGNPRLIEVLDLARDQAAGVLTRIEQPE
jgi:hypothetical protein